MADELARKTGGLDWSKISSVYRGQGQIVAHDTPTMNQGAFRWRNDDGDESSTGATWLAAENTDVTVQGQLFGGLNQRLRIEMYEANGQADSNFDATIQYRLNGGTWTNVPALATGGPVTMAEFTGLVDGNNTTDHGITPTGTGSFDSSNAGQEETGGVAGGSTYDPSANGYAFMEYGLYFNFGGGTGTPLASGDYLDFRIAEADNAAAADYPRFTAEFQATLETEDWALRSDDGDESSTGSAEITDLDMVFFDGGKDVRRRLRFAISELGGDNSPGSATYALYYRVNSGSWTSLVGKTSSNTDGVWPSAGEYTTNNGNTTNHMVAGTGTFQQVGGQSTDGDVTVTLNAGSFMILEFNFTIGATNTANQDDFEFAVFKDGTQITDNLTLPVLTVSKGVYTQVGVNHVTDFRWRDDDGDESSTGATFVTSSKADLAVDVGSGDVDKRIRLAHGNPQTGDTMTDGLPEVWYSVVTATANDDTDVGWKKMSNSTSDPVMYYDSSLTDGGHTTDHGMSKSPVTGAFQGTNFGQSDDNAPHDDGAGGGMDLVNTQWTILEVPVRFNSSQLSDGDTIFFRVFDENNVKNTIPVEAYFWHGESGWPTVNVSKTSGQTLNLSAVTATSSGVDPALTATNAATITLSAVVATVAGTDPALTASGAASIALSAVTATSSGVDPALTGSGSVALALSAVAGSVQGVDPALTGTGAATLNLTAVAANASRRTYYTDVLLGTVLAGDVEAHFDCDEASGTALDDVSGGADGLLVNTGTIEYSQAALVAGDGSSLGFTTSSDYGNLGTTRWNFIHNTADFTIALWIEPDSVSPAGIMGSSVSSTHKGFRIDIGTSGEIRFYLTNGTALRDLISTTTVQAGERYFVVVTSDGSNAAMYVNGGAAEDTAVPITATGDATNLLALANYHTLAGPYDGKIDEVTFLTRGISQAEAQQLYDLGRGYTPAVSVSGSASLALSAVVSSANSVAPAFSGSGSVALNLTAVVSSANSVAPAFSGSGSVALNLTAVVGTVTPQTLSVTTVALLNLTAVVGTLAGVDPALTATSSATLNLSAVVATSSGVDPALAASGAASLALSAVTATSSGVDPVLTGSGSVALALSAVASSAVSVGPAFSGSGSVALALSAVVSSAVSVAPAVTGSGSVALALSAVVSSAVSVAPAVTGSGSVALNLSAVTATSSGVDPALTASGATALALSAVVGTVTGFDPDLANAGAANINLTAVVGTLAGVDPALTASGATALALSAVVASSNSVAPAVAASGATALALSAVTATSSGVDPALTATSSAPLALSAVAGSLQGVDPALTATNAATLALSAVTTTGNLFALAVANDTPDNINLTTVTASANPVDPAVTATNAVSLAISAVVATAAGVDPALTPEPIALALSAVTATAAGVDPALTPEPIALALSAVVATSSPQTLAVDNAGAVALNLSAVVGTLAGVDPALSASSAVALNLSALVGAVTPQTLSVTPEPIALALSAVTATSSAQALGIAPEPIALALSVVAGTLAGVDPALSVGAVALNLSAVPGSLAPIAPTFEGAGVVALNLTTVDVVAGPQPIDAQNIGKDIFLSSPTITARPVPFFYRSDIPHVSCPVPTGYVLPTTGPGTPAPSRQRGGFFVRSCELPRGYPAPNNVYLESVLGRLAPSSLSVT